MKLTEFMVILVAALLFLIPTMKKEQAEIQAQEERPSQERDTYSSRTFRITYKVFSPEHETIADILWMKKAAEVAKQNKIPYFNVLEQNLTRRFVKSAGLELSVIEGVIELDPDPMRAEFDAQEIESLVLTEIP